MRRIFLPIRLVIIPRPTILIRKHLLFLGSWTCRFVASGFRGWWSRWPGIELLLFTTSETTGALLRDGADWLGWRWRGWSGRFLWEIWACQRVEWGRLVPRSAKAFWLSVESWDWEYLRTDFWRWHLPWFPRERRLAVFAFENPQCPWDPGPVTHPGGHMWHGIVVTHVPSNFQTLCHCQLNFGRKRILSVSDLHSDSISSISSISSTVFFGAIIQ